MNALEKTRPSALTSAPTLGEREREVKAAQVDFLAKMAVFRTARTEAIQARIRMERAQVDLDTHCDALRHEAPVGSRWKPEEDI